MCVLGCSKLVVAETQDIDIHAGPNVAVVKNGLGTYPKRQVHVIREATNSINTSKCAVRFVSNDMRLPLGQVTVARTLPSNTQAG